jgi:hypothetical protein
LYVKEITREREIEIWGTYQGRKKRKRERERKREKERERERENEL